MHWDLSSDRPIYAQIIEQMELMICSRSTPGLKAPFGQICTGSAVNPNTMQKELCQT